MAPSPASIGTVVPRNPSPTGYIPGLSISSELDTRSSGASLSSPPYLNHTARSFNLTARSEHNLTARSDTNITTRSDINITTLGGYELTPRSYNLTARDDSNLTARYDVNITTPLGVVTPRSYNITARDAYNLTARATQNTTSPSPRQLTARSEWSTIPQAPYLNNTALQFHQPTVRSEQNLTTRSEYSLTTRSDSNLTARAEYNVLNFTTRSDHNLTARSEYNLTALSDYHNITARSENNLTTLLGYQNITSRSDFNLTTRSDYQNITTRSDLNLTARSDLNLTTRSDFNLTGRSDLNLTGRSDDMLVNTNPSYNLSGAYDGQSPKDVQAAHRLVSRATTTYMPCQGCTDPSKINNNAFFALFAILGVAIVVGTIWFFFHAKHGGFVYEEGDWDDYKSTVLRRKGPDGKTLSNATKSTRLGGGSIVGRHEKLAAMTVIGYDEKGRRGVRAKRGFGGTHSVYYADDFTNYDGGSRADEMSEVATLPDYHRKHQEKTRGGATSKDGKHHSRRYRDRDMQDYKQEKPARVGGMNRQADGSAYDYSDRFSDTMTQITESTNRSTANLIPDQSKPPKDTAERRRVRAEKKAVDDARRMERQWRKEAESAARAIARENAPSPVPPQQAHRKRADSRSKSPKKRDYSFSKGQDDNSTVTGTTTSGTRTASYYDSYRPKNEGAQERAPSKSRGGSPSKGYRRYAESDAGTSDTGTRSYAHTLNQGPVKEKKKSSRGGRDVMAGYRRGMDEDDF